MKVIVDYDTLYTVLTGMGLPYRCRRDEALKELQPVDATEILDAAYDRAAMQDLDDVLGALLKLGIPS